MAYPRAAATQGLRGQAKRRRLELRSRTSPSNGEVERPPTDARSAPRAHTVFPRPRRVTSHASRPAPTIVRRQYHPRLSLRSSQVSAETITDVNECCQKKYGIGNKNDRDTQVGVRY